MRHKRTNKPINTILDESNTVRPKRTRVKKIKLTPRGDGPPTPLRAESATDVNGDVHQIGGPAPTIDIPYTEDVAPCTEDCETDREDNSDATRDESARKVDLDSFSDDDLKRVLREAEAKAPEALAKLRVRPTETHSIIDQLTPEEFAYIKKGLSPKEKQRLEYEWSWWARANQLPPEGGWDGWLILAGRFGGKTRTGAEWVRAEIESGRAKRVALIGETSADGKDVMVRGDSGILAVSPPWNMPTFKPSTNDGRPKLIWPNGAIATLYDAREPDQLRGPQHDLAWLDEGAKFRYAQEVFDQMLFGLRLGDKPRWLMTTTPRPIPLLKKLIRDSHVVVTKYSSRLNLRNIAPSVRENVIDRYAGTRLGRQEIDAEILEDVPGALWNRKNLDENRISRQALPELVRIVVAVDPSITSGDSSNETGIIAGGIDAQQHGYVLEDASLRGSPDQWAKRAVAAYRQYEADRIVAEANQGGEMVERIIKSVAPDVPVTLVRATRGKFVRAEPISAMYEQNKVSHVGTFGPLEDQLISFTPETAAIRGVGDHWDRTDALVWLFTDLFGAMTQPIRRQEADPDERFYASTSIAGRDAYTGY